MVWMSRTWRLLRAGVVVPKFATLLISVHYANFGTETTLDLMIC